ncbi:MAG: pre-peptidase C-terminal domain-containing protein, partial [bacterium]|nr:pre-peptidase C-terminal domain-containing protein [bacterium]
MSLGVVSGSVSRGGVWSDDCSSGSRSGSYARLFEFSLRGEREVTIDLESSIDAYLFLLDRGNALIEEDDDGGSGYNSRITRTLAAGTYRVEATTFGESEAGRFTLEISAEGIESPPPPLSPTPVLAVGDDARPSGRCSSSACRWFEITNLRPGSRVECWREGLGSAYATFTASSQTSTRNCYFSYVGARVYVVADGVRSNTLTWPSASVQSPPPPPPPPPPPSPSSHRASEQTSGCGAESLGRLGGGSASASGQWSDSCMSGNRSGSFARFFEFTLSGEREVTIDLESPVDTYLYLLDSQNGQIESDDDGGSGYNSRITRTLSAGSYRVEATTYSSGETGRFTLRVSADSTGSSAPPPPPAPPTPPAPQTSRPSAGACGIAGVLRGTAGAVSGIPSVEWDAGCVSGVRGNGDHYARRYRLDVRDAGEVTIELSSQTDTYLYLLDAQGDVIVEDDDGGSGTDSRIVRDLSVGSYLVEATTYRAGASGSFTLGVRVARSASPPSPPPPSSQGSDSSSGCGVVSLGAVGGSVSRGGAWTAGCESSQRSGRFARVFGFTLGAEREVTVDLESSVDAYLYLLDGQGRIVDEDDDGGSGLNSRITRTLAAGTYRVEATTYSSGASGSFTLGVRVGAGAPSSQTTPVLAMGDDARPSGRCSSPSCRWFRISNLRPGSRVECWRENMGAAYATFTASSETSTRNCYFSYVGARVYVVANGVRSNTITWPSAPVQPSPPPPPSAQRASEPLSGCAVVSLGAVGGSVSRGGAWTAGCESSQRSGRFARVFDFSLSGEREVTVDLESDVDTYLYLLDSRGRRIDEDDDGGSGLNSRIT